MSAREVKKKIRGAERELEKCSGELKRMEERYAELSFGRKPESILTRYKLEMKGKMERINDLRLQLWGLRQLNLPA